MLPLRQRILDLLAKQDGLTDRQVAEELLGPGTPQQRVNSTCRTLASQGLVRRLEGPDGIIRNHVGTQALTAPPPSPPRDPLAEDSLKRALERWLTADGWRARIAWGSAPGVDIDARRGSERWRIEVKGKGKSRQAEGNNFLDVLGKVLQHMEEAETKHSIALPDIPSFCGLWERLPRLAKERTAITCLFVDECGNVREA